MKPITSVPLMGIKLVITGVVQGVGFRPFLFRLATEAGVTGEVRNSHNGVELSVTGNKEQLELLVKRIRIEAPPAAEISAVSVVQQTSRQDYNGFEIKISDSHYTSTGTPPDLALCSKCLNEIKDPSDRRFGFAFNSCAECGPRYSVINAMPYDRAQTSNVSFPLCESCQEEYNSPDHRRFHVEGTGCPACGPELSFQSGTHQIKGTLPALMDSTTLLLEGKILALKGVSGFHLCCDATDSKSVTRLRLRKHRPAKPLAIMMTNIAQVRRYFELTDIEEQQLLSSTAPVVMLSKAQQILPLCNELAPGIGTIGVMLAYSPLHVMVTTNAGRPLVMTSGNISGSSVCYSNKQAIESLSDIADGFLLHNREIMRPSDDSVVRIIGNRPSLIRRARGFVPRPLSTVNLEHSQRCILALGADMKNCLAMNKGPQVVMSSHNGNLMHPDCVTMARKRVDELCQVLQVMPDLIVVDKHPEYQATRLGERLAEQLHIPLVQVQHHHAHMVSCLIENGIQPVQPVFGLILDGLGFGEDGTFWGGEVLLGNDREYRRIASLKPFPLFGGDLASRQPWRNLIAQLLQAGFSSEVIHESCSGIIPQNMSAAQIDSLWQNQHMFPVSSSAGRLFDAVSALLGCHRLQRFEGEAAMYLEGLADAPQCRAAGDSEPLPLFRILPGKDGYTLDPRTFWHTLLRRWLEGEQPQALARQFQTCFVNSWVQLICQLKAEYPNAGSLVALSGGVFQNKAVLEQMQVRLNRAGIEVCSQQHVPANDGGIALGQLAIASAQAGT